MKATDKFRTIEAALSLGVTVNLSTYTRVIAVTPKTAAKFAAAKAPLFKVSGESLFVARGRSFDCADLCAITFEGPDAAVAQLAGIIRDIRAGIR